MTLLLRTLPWRAFGIVAACAAVLVAVEPRAHVLRGAAVLLAAGAALFCDDASECLADATATPRWVRRGARWLAGAAAAALAWLALLPVADDLAVRSAATELGWLLVVALAAGSSFGGPAAAPVLLVLLVGGQQLSPYVGHLREAAFAAAVAVLASALRDPAARRGATPAPAGEPAVATRGRGPTAGTTPSSAAAAPRRATRAR